ncbi:MAG: hypothetical protein AMXMBFR84_10310 [Candidatus Hydrogenedentota bacterium]
MKVEIHCRTHLHSPASEIAPVELVLMAEAAGYDALFFTDQGNVWSKRDLHKLSEHCEHLKLYSGIEVALPGGYEILVLGADSPVYESLTSPHEIFAQACTDDYLTVLVHPPHLQNLPDVYRLADAIETRTVTHPRKEEEDALQAFADTHRMAPMYASDADGLNYLNKFWIETAVPFSTPQEFRRLVIGGKYANRVRPLAPMHPPSMKVGVMADLADSDYAALERMPRQESPFA